MKTIRNYNKYIVFAIIILLIGVSIVPCISSSYEKTTIIVDENKVNLNYGLVGYWSFDEGSGNIAHDYSGNNNDGTIFGASWTAGVSDGALYFDGNNDAVRVNDDPTLEGFSALTISAWARPYEEHGTGYNQGYVVGKYKDGYSIHSPHRIFAAEGNWVGVIADGSDNYRVRYYNFDVYDWYHLVLWWNGNTLRLYVNGDLADSVSAPITLYTNNQKLRFGERAPECWFHGKIDEIRIYNRDLTYSEIQNLYNPGGENLPPSTPSTPDGPTGLDVGDIGVYSTSATDPNNDMVQYRFDWDANGSHDYSSWTTLDVSGHVGSMSNSWSSSGSYVVKAQARDELGFVSSWSNGLTVDIPDGNNPPNTPSTPVGTTSGSTGISYLYSTSTSDPDDHNVRYGWDWNGDNTVDEWTTYSLSGSTINTPHIFGIPGTYDVKVKAEDIFGAQSGFSLPLTVVISGNNPPNTPSTPSGPTSVTEGVEYTYTTSTTDPDGDFIRYGFDFDNDGIIEPEHWTDAYYPSGEICSVDITFYGTSTRYLRAKAEDEYGTQSGFSSALIIYVSGSNNPPYIPNTPSGPSSLEVGESGTFSTSGTDPEGDLVQYRFNWDDGTISDWTSLGSSGHTDSQSHSWSSSGTYYIRAQTRDEYGSVSGWSSSKSVVVTGLGNHPPNTPSIPSGPSSGVTGTLYSYSTSSTDSDGDMIKYYFDWDDGTGDWTSYVSSGSSASISHSWTSAGIYNIKVRASDSHGAKSSYSSSLTVTITSDGENEPPGKPFITGPTSGKAGNSYTYTAYTTDPEGDDVFYWFYWDDGEEEGWEGPYQSGETCEKSHIWTAEGTYSIKVKAKDEFDLESEWSDPLQIKMPKNKQFTFFSWFYSFLNQHSRVFYILRQILEIK